MNKPFNVGQRFMINGVEFEISFISEGNVRYASVIGGTMSTVSIKQLQELLENNQVTIDDYSCSDDNEHFGLLTISDTDQDEINRRLYYIRGVKKESQYLRSKGHVTPILLSLAEQRDDEHPPSFPTFARWMKSFIISAQAPLSLCPKHRKKGNTDLRFCPTTELIITERIKKDYLSSQRINVRTLYSNIVGHIIEETVKNEGVIQDIKFPSYRTISRRVKALDPFDATKNRDGKYCAIKKFKAAGKSTTGSTILEIVEADGNYIDIILIDKETGEVIGRPYATVLIDTYSRCIISIVITMIPFCSATLLQAMSEAVVPYNNLPRGLYSTIITDNGSDYISNSVRNFARHLSIEIQHGAPRDPNSKPHVERLFKTLNMSLIHNLPGTTFSSITEKGDYESLKKASISLEQLQELIKDWIEIYHATIHSSLGRAPIKMWNQSAQSNPIQTYKKEEMEIIARTVTTRKITKGRVKVYGISWYSHALTSLEHYLSLNAIKKVEVYMNELDLSVVYIKDPREDGLFIQADSVNKEYTSNLSLYEHRQLQKEVKSNSNKDLSTFSDIELATARWELWKKIDSFSSGFATKQIARLKESKSSKNLVPQQKPIKDISTTKNTNIINPPPTVISNGKAIDFTSKNLFQSEEF